MRYIYKMQNLTFGSDGGLTKACEEKHPDEPGLCFMSPHMQDVRENDFLKPFIYKMMILPRQARDKHRRTQKKTVLLQLDGVKEQLRIGA